MLYIVGTPIGNLNDLTIRQAKTILQSDIILAEDTRSVQVLIGACQQLLNSHNPLPKIISYYKEKEFEKLPYVLELLNDGNNVVLVSESGMPLISDPGYLLVSTAVKKNIPFTVIPGPSAIIDAVVAAGFKPTNFMFLGFMPKKSSAILHYINIMESINKLIAGTVFVFYESPNRVNNTLKLIDELIPDADIAICREMTKKFEEIIRGKAKELINQSFKGEITICLHLK